MNIERAKMRETAKITGICNQKGGVGKTVTAVNLGIGLAREGKHVLLVDVDPQGSLTASLGYGAAAVPSGAASRQVSLSKYPFFRWNSRLVGHLCWQAEFLHRGEIN